MPLRDKDHILIEKYLLQQLTEVDQKAFDERSTDLDFKKELDLQSDLKTAFKAEGRDHLKNQLQGFEEKINSDKEKEAVAPPRFKIGRILAIAATVALLLFAGNWLLNSGSSNEALYAQYFQDYPNIISPINKSAPDISAPKKAFQEYELKNYEDAIELLSTLSQDESTFFYIGLSYLSLDQPQTAIDFFDKIKKKDNPFYTPGNWYTALAFLKLGDKVAVKKHCAIVLEHTKTKGMKKLAEDLLKDLD